MGEPLPAPAELAALPPEERPDRLASTGRGLRDAEAARRLDAHGANEPVRAARRRPLRSLLGQFTHMLALLLWFGAGLAFAAGIRELGTAIIAVVLINGLFAFLQEYRAEQVMAALMKRVAVQTRVLRNGEPQRLPAAALVPGDVILLAAGDIAPADGVLLEADGLSIDLSMLTGESLAVERQADAVTLMAAHDMDLPPFIPAGSAVITGTGRALVSATGEASALGRVAAMVEQVQRGRSVLERQVAELSRVTAVIAVLAGTVTLVLATLKGGIDIEAGLTFATGVIVALVPEGLLPTLSVALALGAQRMAGRGAAIRRLAAVEVVGSVTVICTDKTGTLTENRMTVSGFTAADGGEHPATAALRAAVLCNDAPADGMAGEGDVIDRALLEWAAVHGVEIAALRGQYPRLHVQPFDAHRRLMVVTCMVDGEPWQFVKGAPEAVAAMAGRVLPLPLQAALAKGTAAGERVLLLAGAPEPDPPLPLGLVTFRDPPRQEVSSAIAACQAAGIRVVVLTGDHPATATAIAHQIGLATEDMPVLDGEQVNALTDAALVQLLRGNAVVARVDPGQKLRLVQALRRSGEIVVVTGDGINDGPALRAADVGVAMGRRGSEVAKQAADMVLADDNFATIVAAIEEGRAIKANIRRFVSYVFTSNVAELAPFLLYIFFPMPLPLAVIQALAVDLGTDLLPALALGAEAPAPETMRAAPESPARPLLTRALAAKTFLFFGIVEAALGLGAFALYHLLAGWRPFASFAPFMAVEHEAATATFLGIVSGQIGCLFAQREGPLRVRLNLWSNRWVASGLAFELALTLALVYVPVLNRWFAMRPLPAQWLLVLPAGAALFVLLDLVRRAFEARGGQPLPHQRPAASGRP